MLTASDFSALTLASPLPAMLTLTSSAFSASVLMSPLPTMLTASRRAAPLASALAAKKRFPGLLAMFARLGEQTGQLPQMLDRAAR